MRLQSIAYCFKEPMKTGVIIPVDRLGPREVMRKPEPGSTLPVLKTHYISGLKSHYSLAGLAFWNLGSQGWLPGAPGWIYGFPESQTCQ